MFTVKECKAGENACDLCEENAGGACALCERLGGAVQEGDRVFVLRENVPLAAGVLGLRDGKVLLKGVYGDITPDYRDVLIRSLLHVCRCMAPITVRVESTDVYYKRFGFTQTDGGMEVRNTDITFH